MVLAFLRAERSSERFTNLVGAFDPALLDSPDLTSAAENEERAGILQRYRGYRVGAYLFQGFPTDVKWRRWAVAINDLRRFRYARHATWLQLSRGSRLVGDGANNVDAITVVEEGVSISSQVKAVAAAIDRDESVEETICVSTTANPVPEEIVVLEGHVRSTAYLYARRSPSEITTIIGSSPRMTQWFFF